MRAWPRLEAGVARAYGLIVVLASVGLTWIFALRSGQDANWDQLNYHIAVPFLLLQGGFWESVVPSGIQSYLNPAMPVLNYLAIAHLRPVLATLAIAAPQATCFVAAGLICRQVARRAMGEMAWSGPALGGFALCLMSPMALSEAGTTYVDLVTVAPVLFAYGLLHRRSESRWLAIGAGLLIGVSAGLKLTNAIFVLGVPALVWLRGGSWRGRLVRLALVAVGSLVGLAASAGWWSAQVWQHFGNPVFPLANALFRSPDFPAVSINDTRFLPHSVWDALRWPIYWVTGGSPTPGLLSPGAEVDPRDARFLFAVLGVMALAVAALLRPAVLKRPQIGLIAAWGCVYVVWLAGFGIHRYMIGLEILTGAVLLALVMMLPRRARAARSRCCAWSSMPCCMCRAGHGCRSAITGMRSRRGRSPCPARPWRFWRTHRPAMSWPACPRARGS